MTFFQLPYTQIHLKDEYGMLKIFLIQQLLGLDREDCKVLIAK